MRSRASLLSLLLLPVAAGACLIDQSTTESSGWGIGTDPACDESSEHCWASDDHVTVRAALHDLDTLLTTPTAERKAVLQDALQRTRAVGYKLTDHELEVVDAEEARLAEAGDELDDEQARSVVRGLRNGGLTRLEIGMLGAYMQPVADVVEAEQQGLAAAGAWGGVGDVIIPDSYSDEQKAALHELMGAGGFGMFVAAMLVTSGALELDYQVENARFFGEYIERNPDGTVKRIYDSGLSLTAKVEKIVHSEEIYAAEVGAIATGGSLLLPPAAGALAGASYEIVKLFEIHMKMAFRIAQVYGRDVDDKLEIVSMVMMVANEGLAAEAIDVSVTNSILPLVVGKAAVRLGVTHPSTILANIGIGAWQMAKRIMSRQLAKQVATEVAEQGTKAILKQFLGWATFGATVAISAGADYWLTGRLGRRLGASTQAWMHGFLQQGSTFMGNRAARECGFMLYSHMLYADGRLRDDEKKLFLAYLGKSYYESETLSHPLGTYEQQQHAQYLADVRDGVERQQDAMACLDDSLASADEQHRIVFLAYLYAMMQIDRDESRAERTFYQSVRTAVWGGMFRRIDEPLMDQIERSVRLEVYLTENDIARDFGVTIEDVVPAMDVPAATQNAFAAGFGR